VHIIYRAADNTDAHIVAGLLESHGISAHVAGHFLQGGVGDLAPTDLARVYVESEDVDAARQLIEEYQQTNQSEPTAQNPELASIKPRGTWWAVIVFALIAALAYLIAWR